MSVSHQPDGVLLWSSLEKSCLIDADGLLVHPGTADPGARLDGVLGLVREERIQAILNA